jgi:hypothetical protein
VAARPAVVIKGIDDALRQLRRLDDEQIQKDLKEANLVIANRVVAWAKARAGSDRMASKAASTLKASRAQASAQVSFGGARAPFAGGSEFGAFRNQRRDIKSREVRTKRYVSRYEDLSALRGGSRKRIRVRVDDDVRQTTGRTVLGWNQFKDWRGNDRRSGYWLYPSIRDHETQIVDQYGDAIEKLAQKAFPD